jgi:hypothetical protein
LVSAAPSVHEEVLYREAKSMGNFFGSADELTYAQKVPQMLAF